MIGSFVFGFDHLKCKSPVMSNSTVGITLAMNFKKISKAK